MRIQGQGSRPFIILLLLGMLVAHSSVGAADLDNEARIWVYVQINVPQSDGIEDYYYFGRIRESIYNGIVNNKVTEEYFHILDTRYYDEGEYYSTEDELYTTTVVFRTKDIVMIEKIKGDPRIIKKVPGV